MNAFGDIGVLLIDTLGTLYIMAVLLRFLLQVSKADFYNPITQVIVRITDPVVQIFRRIIPGIAGIDFSSLVAALLLECAAIAGMLLISGNSLPAFGAILTWSIAGLISMVLNIYFWTLLISIISSFIAPFSGHPALVLVRQLTEPVMAPFRRILPPMGGLDLSPIFVFLALQILRILLVQPLNAPGFVPGL